MIKRTVVLKASIINAWQFHNIPTAKSNLLYERMSIRHMSRDMTKPTKSVCAQRRLRSAWASAQSDQSLRCPQEESLGPYLPIQRNPRLWSDWADAQADLSSLGTHSFCWFCNVVAHIKIITKWPRLCYLWRKDNYFCLGDEGISQRFCISNQKMLIEHEIWSTFEIVQTEWIWFHCPLR